jgi:methyl-accepting chemotaxis protein
MNKKKQSEISDEYLHLLWSHIYWKETLQRAIFNKEKLDVASISKDNHCDCDLGKWLRDEHKHHISKLKSYHDLMEKHTLFHIEAGKVAEIANTQQYDDAQWLFEATKFNHAADAVTSALFRLKEETDKAQIKIPEAHTHARCFKISDSKDFEDRYW